MDLLKSITQDYMKSDIPAFNVGDTVKVHIKIKEGNIPFSFGACITKDYPAP